MISPPVSSLPFAELGSGCIANKSLATASANCWGIPAARFSRLRAAFLPAFLGLVEFPSMSYVGTELERRMSLAFDHYPGALLQQSVDAPDG